MCRSTKCDLAQALACVVIFEAMRREGVQMRTESRRRFFKINYELADGHDAFGIIGKTINESGLHNSDLALG